MTRKRNDEHSTEFGLWLRDQDAIDSELGFITSNIDFVWKNYKTGLWMLLEEKRYGKLPKWWQVQLYKQVDKNCVKDNKYRGFHLIVFQNTSPEDGDVWLDGRYITMNELTQFLRFKSEQQYYTSYFPQRSYIDHIIPKENHHA